MRASLLIAVLSLAFASVSHAADSSDDPAFRAFIREIHRAQIQFAQGHPAAFRAIYSHAPDATIFGAFGGYEQGWEQIRPRLAWASSQFSEGSRTFQVLSAHAEGDLGCVVQLERIHYLHPKRRQDADLVLRATMILRREHGEWRILHRHADSLMRKEAPR